MKFRVQQLIVLAITMLTGVIAQAHPGHDHAAMSSSAVHAILFLSLAAVAGAAVYVLVKKSRSEAQK